MTRHQISRYDPDDRNNGLTRSRPPPWPLPDLLAVFTFYTYLKFLPKTTVADTLLLMGLPGFRLGLMSLCDVWRWQGTTISYWDDGTSPSWKPRNLMLFGSGNLIGRTVVDEQMIDDSIRILEKYYIDRLPCAPLIEVQTPPLSRLS